MIAYFLFFFFNDTATTEIYTLSLHDALPIYAQGTGQDPAYRGLERQRETAAPRADAHPDRVDPEPLQRRSEEHTSELQSHVNLVCRLLLEKKKKKKLS